MADELTAKLERRQMLNEQENVEQRKPSFKVFNPYTEFREFSRKEIKEYENTFKRFDIKKDNFIDFEELKRMMEILGAPQTHIGLKEMIKQVDEDGDSKISFREFLLIFHKAKLGEFSMDSGLGALAKLTEINVDEAGVRGAKDFFEAKIEEQTNSRKFEEEIRNEQEEKRLQELEKVERRRAFKEKANFFQAATS